MKSSTSLLLTLVLQASSLCSGFEIPSNKLATSPSNNQKKCHHIGRAIAGTLAGSLLPHPKLAHAIGVGSRVPMPASPIGDLATVNKRVGQTAFLFVWTLFIVAAIEWEGFDYFKHLWCRMKNLGKEEDIADVGLAKESDWSSYSQQLQMSKKKYRIGARIRNLLRRFSRSKVYATDSAEIENANKLFQQKQHEQHHHVVHVSRLKDDIGRPSYLESLSSKYTSIDPNISVKHEKSYLDTLSDIKAKKSPWADYKTVVDRAKKQKRNQEEALKNEVSDIQNIMQDQALKLALDAHTVVDRAKKQKRNQEEALKNEVSDLQNMMQDQALKLALDAHTQQLQHSNDNTNSKATEDLKNFDRMATEFEDTVGKELAKKRAAGIIEDDSRSIVYEL